MEEVPLFVVVFYNLQGLRLWADFGMCFNIIQQMRQKFPRHKIIVGGDFNIDLLNENNSFSLKLLDIAHAQGLQNIISQPTRLTSESKTLIDHIFVSETQDITSGQICADISDHNMTFLSIPMKSMIISPPSSSIHLRFSGVALEKIKEKLKKMNWEEITSAGDVDTAVNVLYSKLGVVFRQECGRITNAKNKRRIRINTWMTKGLLISRHTKFKLAKIAAKSPSPSLIQRSKDFTKLYNKVIRKAKENHYYELFRESRFDSKRTWQILNEVIQRKQSTSSIPHSFKHNGLEVSGNKDIAENFNEHFTNVGYNLTHRFPESSSGTSFLFHPVTQHEIVQLLSRQKPKSSSGHDKISMKVLRYLREEIAIPLTAICNKSLISGTVPSKYKIALVKPLYKAKERNLFTNYRPISLLSNLSKILERVVESRLRKHLEENNILFENQYGFRAKHNTTHAVLKLSNLISNALNEGKQAIAIFVDTKKAFDCTDHDILLKKLRALGVGGVEYSWFASYLSNRPQAVKIKGICSTFRNLKTGVPQGGVLSALLYVIFTNDIKNVTPFQKILYADDLALIATHKSLPNLIDEVNRDLPRIEEWYDKNKLTLHPDKTQFILFSQKNNKVQPDCNIFLKGKLIERIGEHCQSKSVRYLGVLIDEKLSWKYHAIKVRNNVSKGVFAITSCRKLLPMKVKKLIYDSLVKSHLEYASPIWAGTHQCNLKPIHIIQKKCIRAMKNLNYRDHTTNAMKDLDILPFPSLLILNQITLTKQILNAPLTKEIPVALASDFKLQTTVSNLRDSAFENMAVPFTQKDYIKRQPLFRLPALWQTLPGPLLRLPNTPSATFKHNALSYLSGGLTEDL